MYYAPPPSRMTNDIFSWNLSTITHVPLCRNVTCRNSIFVSNYEDTHASITQPLKILALNVCVCVCVCVVDEHIEGYHIRFLTYLFKEVLNVIFSIQKFDNARMFSVLSFQINEYNFAHINNKFQILILNMNLHKITNNQK